MTITQYQQKIYTVEDLPVEVEEEHVPEWHDEDDDSDTTMQDNIIQVILTEEEKTDHIWFCLDKIIARDDSTVLFILSRCVWYVHERFGYMPCDDCILDRMCLHPELEVDECAIPDSALDFGTWTFNQHLERDDDYGYNEYVASDQDYYSDVDSLS